MDGNSVPVDRDGAEGAVDGGVALLVNGGIARADVDRVMAGGATLVDHAALAERQGVMAAADDDLADACDIDPIVTVAYDYCPLAIDGGINIAATRNTDAAHRPSPLIEPLIAVLRLNNKSDNTDNKFGQHGHIAGDAKYNRSKKSVTVHI